MQEKLLQPLIFAAEAHISEALDKSQQAAFSADTQTQRVRLSTERAAACISPIALQHSVAKISIAAPTPTVSVSAVRVPRSSIAPPPPPPPPPVEASPLVEPTVPAVVSAPVSAPSVNKNKEAPQQPSSLKCNTFTPHTMLENTCSTCGQAQEVHASGAVVVAAPAATTKSQTIINPPNDVAVADALNSAVVNAHDNVEDVVDGAGENVADDSIDGVVNDAVENIVDGSVDNVADYVVDGAVDETIDGAVDNENVQPDDVDNEEVCAQFIPNMLCMEKCKFCGFPVSAHASVAGASALQKWAFDPKYVSTSTVHAYRQVLQCCSYSKKVNYFNRIF
jgi:hypothetical protein